MASMRKKYRKNADAIAKGLQPTQMTPRHMTCINKKGSTRNQSTFCLTASDVLCVRLACASNQRSNVLYVLDVSFVAETGDGVSCVTIRFPVLIIPQCRS